jgi:hypothetical protein
MLLEQSRTVKVYRCDGCGRFVAIAEMAPPAQTAACPDDRDHEEAPDNRWH